jgi:hypothetical protein
LKQKIEGKEEIDSAEKRWKHLEQTLKVTAVEIIRERKYKNKQRMIR